MLEEAEVRRPSLGRSPPLGPASALNHQTCCSPPSTTGRPSAAEAGTHSGLTLSRLAPASPSSRPHSPVVRGPPRAGKCICL